MIDLNKVAGAIAIHMAKDVDLEQDRIDQLRYGLEIILGTLIKGAVMFFLAYMLNIITHVAVALAAAGLFRLLSGGAHCTSYWRCLLLGVTIYLLIGLAAVNVAGLLTNQIFMVMAGIVFLVAVACIIKWAPGEVPYRTMKRREKIRFKVLSMLYLSICIGLILYLTNNTANSILLAILLALVMQTLSFTPWGYVLVARADRCMAKITGKGGEPNAFN